jgi:uroporphyrinogen-III synthase
MDHLAGWTIAVTADRRAAEQAELLQRRGSDVVLAPLLHTAPVAEAQVRDATFEVLSAPVDVVVATTGAGVRSWLAMAWTWGVGEALGDALRAAEVIARGAKAYGALAGEDVPIAWRPVSETLDGVLAHLDGRDLQGCRIAVQLPGTQLDRFTAALRSRGAEVLPIPVYEVGPAVSTRAGERLALAAARGELDAITCTSVAAVRALAAIHGLVEDLHRTGVATACVGPLTTAAAREAGLPHVVTAEPHRLGAMVRTLGEEMARRGRTLRAAGVHLRHQGSRLAVDGTEVRLTPRERRLFEAMLAGDGAVISKERLAGTAWDTPVDTHTVEVAVNRLRRKLGPAAVALETTNRRGYRIAV